MTKVLLVDDESDVLEFMRYTLIKEGYEVFTATNGNEAIEIAKEEYLTILHKALI